MVVNSNNRSICYCLATHIIGPNRSTTTIILEEESRIIGGSFGGVGRRLLIGQFVVVVGGNGGNVRIVSLSSLWRTGLLG